MRTFADEEEALAFLGTIPWGLAAGVVRSHEAAAKYAGTGITMLGYGSMIEESDWRGNPGDVYHYEPRTGLSINNIGLGDPGIAKHLETLADTRRAASAHGATLWESYSGRLTTDPEAYRKAAARLAALPGTSVKKANAGCPNVNLATGRKKPTCFDLVHFEEVVAAWKEGAGKSETAVKVSPTTDADLIGEWVSCCLKYGVDYLVMCNTVPNTHLLTDDFRPAVTGNRGGGAGTMLEPFVSAMLREAVPLVKGSSLKLIATGSILSGITPYKYLLLGAHGFAFNTLCTRPGGGPQSIAELITGTDAQHGLLYYLVKHGLPSGQYA